MRVKQADKGAVGAHDRREPVRASASVEDRLVRSRRGRRQLGRHDSRDLSEPVDPSEIRLGDQADRAVVLHHDCGAVGALGEQDKRASPTVCAGRSMIGVS